MDLVGRSPRSPTSPPPHYYPPLTSPVLYLLLPSLPHSCPSTTIPASNPIAESIPHVLLHCPRYAGLRSQLEDDIRQPPPLPLPPLSLSTILVASPPPPPFPTSLLPRLIRLTSTFLGAVASIRAADGLPHLDTG